MTENSQFYGTPHISEDYAKGYKQGIADEKEHIIHLIEDGVWKDVDMLVEQIKENSK